MASGKSRTAARPLFKVRRSKVHGLGVFALRPIKKGTRIVEYLGERISHAVADRRYEDHDDSICSEALSAAERFMPGISDQVEFTGVSRWAQQYPPVGHYAGLGEFQRRSQAADRTVQLCGEFAATPHLATATSSGERAARALAAHLPLGI